jgi:hypothetical protein
MKAAYRYSRLLTESEFKQRLRQVPTACRRPHLQTRSPKSLGLRREYLNGSHGKRWEHKGLFVFVWKPACHHRNYWAVDPREFATNAVAERLRASGNFAQVKLYDGRSDIDYVLSGRLEKLEEIHYEGGVKVEVAISAQMTNLASGATV